MRRLGSNGNVFKRHGQGIMIMNKDLGASLKGHLWDVCEGGEAWPEGGRWGGVLNITSDLRPMMLKEWMNDCLYWIDGCG